ncbi:hypothetical protein N7513_011733 [Penicillium frequentans]|uniref:Uncharacterized protein n=1 Tax=Penicillium frequentans TaxID=3151616 RepID=A0AAD6GIH3_9EURO|nr:hypothetical protein N7513_011733 [Penicillium glabrum]KAJ5546629.1 hypothetical protein N7494_004214 [Penicillium glabrum]
MTVANGTPATPPQRPSLLAFQKNTRKRWPPMANRNALPYKLTVISKEKLAREATAPDPDLRRCVAHFRLHCGSVLWTENDMKSRISSFEFEESESESEDDFDHKKMNEIKLRQKSQKSQNTIVTVQINSEEKEPLVTSSEILPESDLSEKYMDRNLCAVTVQPIAA